MCQIHSEAKQTETSKFGVEKGLLQRPSKEDQVAQAQKTRTLMVFREEFFFFFIILYYFYLFIYFGCVGSSFLCEDFLQLRQAGAALHRGVRASHYHGLSRCGAQAPDTQAQ